MGFPDSSHCCSQEGNGEGASGMEAPKKFRKSLRRFDFDRSYAAIGMLPGPILLFEEISRITVSLTGDRYDENN
ncbi:hypothetical protein Pelo_8570 [Pelomyxa schiedti]|nr:hypothetical protein Pelo_8570 [Pelomyxa schiedti]